MISRDLSLMRSQFMSFWCSLPDEDKKKGIPSALIAEWIHRDIEVVAILMALMDFRKFRFSGISYWVYIPHYDAFRESIDDLLLK